MAKRFTASDKWEDVWFSSLTSEQKLFWLYVLDKCDSSGIWEKNFKAASFFLGFKLEEKDCSFMNDRIIDVNGSKWFIPKFIEFQYGELTDTCKPHIPIIKQLSKYNLKGYPKGINTLNTRQDYTIQDNIIQDKIIQEDDIQKLWISTFGRNPKIPELEITEWFINKFGLIRTKQIFKNAVLENFHSVKKLWESIDQNGNLIPKSDNKPAGRTIDHNPA